jgi:hypothetical protein
VTARSAHESPHKRSHSSGSVGAGLVPRPAPDRPSTSELVAGRGAPRWMVSSFNDRAHALAPQPTSATEQFEALCGLVMDCAVQRLETQPSNSRVCGTCTVAADFEPTCCLDLTEDEDGDASFASTEL